MVNNNDFKEFLLSILNGKNAHLIKELELRWDEWNKEKEKPKKGYEILSFKHKNYTYTKWYDGSYHRTHNEYYNTSLSHVPENAEIASVRRISDLEVFTIGDRIEGFGDTPIITIDNFTIDHFDNTQISAYHKNGYSRNYKAWKKVNNPFLKTEDGITVEEYLYITQPDWEEGYKRLKEIIKNKTK